MRTYIVNTDAHKHFNQRSAEDGTEHHGAHLTLEQVLQATKDLEFDECVTDYDKYVAFNVAYADLCKTLSNELIIETAYAFFFEDEDAPCNKIWRYMQSF